MAVTQITLALSLGMVGMILSLMVGTFGGKSYKMFFPSLAIFGAVIPIILALAYIEFSPLITLLDWPNIAFYDPGPLAVGFVTSWVGGLLGIKAGGYWNRDDDRSCFQCLLVPVSLLLIGSLAVLFLL
jgi:hypothetical protein